MQLPQLTLDLHEADGRRVIEAFGEIDIATIGALDRCLRDCTAGFDGLVEVDLRGVRFMDSTGVWLLCGAALAAKEAAWSLSVLPSDAALRVFTLSGTLDRVPIGETLVAAG